MPGSSTGLSVEALYDPARDTLYQVAPVETESSPQRLTVTTFEGWSKTREAEGTPGSSRWSVPLPESFQAGATPSLALAGPLLFVLNPVTRGILVAEADTGVPLGQIAPTTSLSSASGTTPCPALRAHRRRDGSYLVLIQDPTSPRVLVHHLDDPQKSVAGK